MNLEVQVFFLPVFFSSFKWFTKEKYVSIIEKIVGENK